MRLLYLTRKFPPAIGGMEQMNYHLVEALRPLTDVDLIAWGHSQLGLPWFGLTAALRITRRLSASASRRPDLMVIGDAALSPLAIALTRRTGIPLAAIAHGLDVTFPRFGYPGLVLPALRRCNRVICVSRFTAAACAERGVPSDALCVIPNGIRLPPTALPRDQARQALREKGWIINPQTPFILTVGRLVPRKGVAMFIKNGFPRLRNQFPDIHYVVVGQGPDEATIRDAIQLTGATSNVFLAGKVNAETLHLAYSAADLFIMPNHPVPDNPEGFGIVAMEASAYGLPVVATAVEGLADAVQDHVNGRSIPSGSMEAFAQAAAELLADHDARAALGIKARAFAMEHTWDNIAPRYVSAFEHCILKN